MAAAAAAANDALARVAAQVVRDVSRDFESTVFKLGWVACTVSAGAIVSPVGGPGIGEPVRKGILAGAFLGGACTMFAAVWLRSTGTRLGAGAKATIATLSSLALAVAAGVGVGDSFKFAISTLAAPFIP